jgi:hypothetical protein
MIRSAARRFAECPVDDARGLKRQHKDHKIIALVRASLVSDPHVPAQQELWIRNNRPAALVPLPSATANACEAFASERAGHTKPVDAAMGTHNLPLRVGEHRRIVETTRSQASSVLLIGIESGGFERSRRFCLLGLYPLRRGVVECKGDNLHRQVSCHGSIQLRN